MAERRKQGLCYYYDHKYSPGHKCKEHKLFQIDVTGHGSLEEATPLKRLENEVEENQQEKELPEEPVISLHVLAGIFVPHIAGLERSNLYMSSVGGRGWECW